jgi:hypothetical protein
LRETRTRFIATDVGHRSLRARGDVSGLSTHRQREIARTLLSAFVGVDPDATASVGS